MKFTDCTWEELKNLINEKVIAILPLGCTEQQGKQLTVDWDNLFITELCNQSSAIAEEKFQTKSLVLPTIPVGPTHEHFHWLGYLNISSTTHNSMVYEICEGLINQGFKKIIIWPGCGGHDIKDGGDKLQQNYPEVKILVPENNFHQVALQVFGAEKFEGGHADALATSLAMYLSPGSVRLDKLQPSNNKPINWSIPKQKLNFGQYTESGALGDISKSTAEIGKKAWEIIIKESARIIADF